MRAAAVALAVLASAGVSGQAIPEPATETPPFDRLLAHRVQPVQPGPDQRPAAPVLLGLPAQAVERRALDGIEAGGDRLMRRRCERRRRAVREQ